MQCLATARQNSGMNKTIMTSILATILAIALTGALLHPALADDDADRAREGVEAGRYVPLEDIIRSARQRYPGRIVEVELDDDEYEIEILQDDGTKVELEYDARTGKLLEVDVDD